MCPVHRAHPSVDNRLFDRQPDPGGRPEAQIGRAGTHAPRTDSRRASVASASRHRRSGDESGGASRRIGDLADERGGIHSLGEHADVDVREREHVLRP